MKHLLNALTVAYQQLEIYVLIGHDTMSKAERLYFNKVAELGCMVCKMPAEIHHLRTDAGMGMKSKEVIPLCPTHHRNGGYGVAIHAGRLEFEANFGTELELLEKMKGLL
jgi:hypothetical protein